MRNIAIIVTMLIAAGILTSCSVDTLDGYADNLAEFEAVISDETEHGFSLSFKHDDKPVIYAAETAPTFVQRTYFLENATNKQRLERLSAVMLFADGSARLGTPLISSYMMPECTYTLTDSELLIHPVIKDEWEEGFYGVKNGDDIAIFQIADDGALVFESASVSVFADVGARYVSTAVAAREWLDYLNDEEALWNSEDNLMIPEFPRLVFSWTPLEVKALGDGWEKPLFSGMPIWNVFLLDLTNDGLPEFCATVSIGSGITDNRIIVYDYAEGKQYELEDRMLYDYSLTLNEGQLVVTQSGYLGGGELGAGSLALIDGELTVLGIDRSRPELESGPEEERSAEFTLHEAFYQIVLTLYEMDAGLNGGIKYVAADLAGVFEDQRPVLEEALRAWADSLGFELLLDTFEGLSESGYISVNPGDMSGFRDGVLFTFNDAVFDGESLTVTATKYRSPLGAVGAEFTTRFADGQWIVDEPEMIFMA